MEATKRLVASMKSVCEMLLEFVGYSPDEILQVVGHLREVASAVVQCSFDQTTRRENTGGATRIGAHR
uniref:Uncharacterized protein n=1 Tax=Leersia perrieri TaxID=77586 RepID=A0A0D9WM71_9ORYZ